MHKVAPIADSAATRAISNASGPTCTAAFDFKSRAALKCVRSARSISRLWDLLGKSLNAPVYRLIGGKANPAGPPLQHVLSRTSTTSTREPEKIMRELIDTRGIRAIKIWPFDGAAKRNRNQFITECRT